jgi:hypothetical protein
LNSDAKWAKIYRPKRNRDAYNNALGKSSPSLSHDAANSDKYQQKTTKHPALKTVSIEAEIYALFASAIFLPNHREAFS